MPRDIVYTHKFLWEENNGYSHVRASLMGASLVVPLVNGRLTLGQYQQIVLLEFDNRCQEPAGYPAVHGRTNKHSGFQATINPELNKQEFG